MTLFLRSSPLIFRRHHHPVLTLLQGGHRQRSLSTEAQVVLDHLIHPDFEDRVITTVTLNRPKANAMGSVMLEELASCLEQLEQQQDETGKHRKTRCVVVRSSFPKVFSAGADLKERRDMTMDQAESFVTKLRMSMQRVAALPLPVIAAVEGVAVGGGFELALACDLRVASETAIFGMPETTLAIIPGAGGTQRLSRLIGASRAKELIWTGRRFSGQEAYQWGVIDKVVPSGHAVDAALTLAWQIAANGPIAIQASKEAIDQGLTVSTMEEALEIERQCYGRTLPSKDRLEGLAAFAESRTPNYTGE